MMNRRELIKAILPIAATPVVAKGVEIGKKYEIEPEKKYIVFISDEFVDSEIFASYERALPAGTSIWPVRAKYINNAIRIYKVD